jgi:FkbM family methyltransferase
MCGESFGAGTRGSATIADVLDEPGQPYDGATLTPFALAQRAYGLVLRLAYDGRGLPWAVHDQTIRIHPTLRHLIPHDGEPALYEFLRTAIRDGDRILDVGAFLGVYAILQARLAGPGGRVIAFEPTPRSAALARRHLEYNAVTDRVELLAVAVSDRPGRAELFEYAEPYVNSLVSAPDAAAASSKRDVEVVTIDDVCRRFDFVPALIRMDVQGAEIHALRGARETIRKAGARLRVVVEMHPQCWPDFGMDEAIARDTIESLGLSAAPLVPGERLFSRDSHAVLTPV